MKKLNKQSDNIEEIIQKQMLDFTKIITETIKSNINNSAKVSCNVKNCKV